MFLDSITIRNYKSLRNVHFAPSGLAVLVGPNGAGKSNFADAVHFLSEVYQFGLDPEVAQGWQDGEVRLSEYLDSGLVPRAVPVSSTQPSCTS